MTFRAFRNALCILGSLDFAELHDAGLVRDTTDFGRFCDDPVRAVLRFDEAQADRFWVLVQTRMPVVRAAAQEPLSRFHQTQGA